MSLTSKLSVNSSFNRLARAPVRCSTSKTDVAKSGWLNCRALTLTDSTRCPCVGLAAQRTSCWHVASSTQAPSGKMRPVSSANEMNSPGDTRPRAGCCQRSSTSAPVTRKPASS